MMITYDRTTKTTTMNLVDLEHCGFDVDEYHDELYLAGIEDENAKWPDSLLVRFKKGAVVTGERRKGCALCGEMVKRLIWTKDGHALVCEPCWSEYKPK
jgi:hypothetical protein